MRNRKAKKKWALVFDESGAIAVISALIFAAVAGFVGLALDFGHYYKVQAELQRTADASALAGVAGFLPYSSGSPPQDPYWAGGVTAANRLIRNEDTPLNEADNIQVPAGLDCTITTGYWWLKAAGAEPFNTSRFDEAKLPQPAMKVTLSKNVTMYLAPLIGFPGPMKATATSIAILPEVYAPTGVPPLAVAMDAVYDESKVLWEVDYDTQDIKIQSNKGLAGWVTPDLYGNSGVPEVNIGAGLIAGTTGTEIRFVPGTKAVLTKYITAGETILVPVVADGFAKDGIVHIITWAAFKVDPPPDGLDANSMNGKFVDIGFFPKQQPGEPRPTSTTPMVWGTPKTVSPQ